MYYGLALQMLTYLDVVTSNAQTWMKKGHAASPAGVLYFHIHNPIVEMKGDATEAEIEKEILKKFKMKGLVLGDADVVRLMDNKLSTGSSDIISAGLKKTVALVRVQVLQVSKSLTYCKNMYTIRLKISEKILQKVLSILLLIKWGIKQHVRSVTSNLFVNLMSHWKIISSDR